ncbi:3-deoxy-7-phosphoheptulonate synthase [Saccharopolyspora sp. MS10]|uniref:3-deoxy-7-phosphoheptulonate synthase n=1 Tax=Saccharopolyspora sp. MS10 TaxID=3385973 RepID=UPI0039A3C490
MINSRTATARRTPWTPDSWRPRVAHQQPAWDPAELERAVAELQRLPALVQPGEIWSLRRLLAAAAHGDVFVVQAGDCAESFEDVTTEHITRRGELIARLARSVEQRSGRPAIALGRIAGQYAKPRSAPTELVNGRALPVFRGHMVNDAAPTPSARRPDAARLLQGYYRSATTLNLLRTLPTHLARPVWVSRECLLLPYDRATLRNDPASEEWYLSSTHFPWIGERTRDVEGAHVELLSGVVNPLGVKVGPTVTPEEVVELCDRLNPHGTPGRLTLITRLGSGAVHRVLPDIVAAVSAAGHPVVWMCDPMHGNTIQLPSGIKTRRVADMLAELDGWFDVLTAAGAHPGGLHLECTPDDVQECVDEDPSEVGTYRTLCDPRLDAGQALTLIHGAAQGLRRRGRPVP